MLEFLILLSPAMIFMAIHAANKQFNLSYHGMETGFLSRADKAVGQQGTRENFWRKIWRNYRK